MVALTHLVCFLFFLKRTADVMALGLIVECFGGLFIWIVSRLIVPPVDF